MDQIQPGQTPNGKSEKVIADAGKSGLSDLWKTEDYWAIWLGFLLLIAGVIIYFPRGPKDFRKDAETAEATLAAEKEKAPFKTIAWYKADDSIKKLKATSSNAGKWIKKSPESPTDGKPTRSRHSTWAPKPRKRKRRRRPKNTRP